MAAHQAPQSLGFSRQEHWSGLPFSSPMHEGESEVTQSCPTFIDPTDCSPPGSSVRGIFQARVVEWAAIALVHGILQARILEWVAFPFSRGSSQPRIKPRSSALQVDSLPAKPQGKPKNTGVGSLALLQGIFPTQESNWGLLHCRGILYQLSYQGICHVNFLFKAKPKYEHFSTTQ